MNIPIQSIESTFTEEQPTTKNKIKFRRYKFKDEKALLIAKQSEDETDIFDAILNNVKNCCLSTSIDIEKIPEFELVYFFLKLRGQSVSNIIEMPFIDNEDKQEYSFQVNIEDIKITNLQTEKDYFNLPINNEGAGILLKYPTSSIYKDKDYLLSENDTFVKLIIKCMDKLYDKNDVYPIENYKEEELIEWIDNLSLDVFEKLEQFVLNIPTIFYEIKYKNTLGNERRIVLNSLSDFFMLH